MSLSLEDAISVAEEAVERAGLAVPVVMPVGHEDDPAYRAAIAPFEALCTQAVGSSMVRKIRSSSYELNQEGNPLGFVTAMGSIVVRQDTTKLTILHECAHLVTRTQEGRGGHTEAFAVVARDLYRKFLGDSAADTFWRILEPYLIKTSARTSKLQGFPLAKVTTKARVAALRSRIEAVTLDYERGTDVEAYHPTSDELMGSARVIIEDQVATVVRASSPEAWVSRSAEVHSTIAEWLRGKGFDVRYQLSDSERARLNP